jgi:hypothetical protein
LRAINLRHEAGETGLVVGAGGGAARNHGAKIASSGEEATGE